MESKQIKYMVDRFLTWRLPENFNPDAGISFKRDYNENTPYPMKHEPVGTNLFDATQVEEMVRYMIDGLPLASQPAPSGASPYTGVAGSCPSCGEKMLDNTAFYVCQNPSCQKMWSPIPLSQPTQWRQVKLESQHMPVSSAGEPAAHCGVCNAAREVVDGEHVCGLSASETYSLGWRRGNNSSVRATAAPASTPASRERGVWEALTFDEFARINRQRCESKDGFNHQLGSWSLSDWFTALLGELGEAANIAKKLNRVRDGIPGNKLSKEELRVKLRQELGDAFVYLDLLAQSEGLSIGEAAIEVFNAKSKELGCSIRMSAAARATERGVRTLVSEFGQPKYYMEPSKQAAKEINEHFHLGYDYEYGSGFMWLRGRLEQLVIKVAQDIREALAAAAQPTDKEAGK